MNDWIANGCRLGWLIDLDNQTIYIYRPNQERQDISGLDPLSGEDILSGFSLDLATLTA